MEAVETCVEEVIRDRIECFDALIDASDELEIAGHFMKGEEIPLGDGKQPDTVVAERECFKVINHNLKSAVLVDVDTVIRTHPREMIHIIDALKTGITTRLYGVTRIVG